MSDGLFSTFAQVHRPLSMHLAHIGYRFMQRIQRSSSDELTKFEGPALAYAIQGIRPAVPIVGAGRPADVSEERGSPRLIGGVSVATVRHHIALQVIGDQELLRYWPDRADGDLRPVDEAAIAALGGMDGVRSGDQQVVSAWEQASETWTLGTVDSPLTVSGQDVWALYTFVDLTVAEEAMVAKGELDLNAIFDGRRSLIASIVKAVADQTNTYFDDVLPAEAGAAVVQRREELTNRERVTESLSFPQAWIPEPPALAAEVLSTATETSMATDVTVASTPRLSPASFEDVQRTIRVWADSVERTPTAFGLLTEDQLSDLLAATLNATLPGAKREVYTTTGRSDIFVSADALSDGSGPAKVFICESKFTYSTKVVRRALDPQLFSYLNAHDTAAVLLLLVIQKDFFKARDTYLDVLRNEVSGFLGEDEGPVAGWPILRFTYGARTVKICAATVSVPK